MTSEVGACNLSDNPFLDATGLGGETDADFEELPGVGGIRTGMTFAFNLLQGFVRAGVYLEFEDVDVILVL